MERLAVRLIIDGRVQGVGYRWWARREARRLGLAGWVCNREDGSVELLAIGSAEQIDQLTGLCGEGPPAASVVAVERQEAEDDGSLGFEARGAV